MLGDRRWRHWRALVFRLFDRFRITPYAFLRLRGRGSVDVRGRRAGGGAGGGRRRPQPGGYSRAVVIDQVTSRQAVVQWPQTFNSSPLPTSPASSNEDPPD